MDKEKLMRAQFIHQQIEEMQEHLGMLDGEMQLLEQYSENLGFLSESDEKEILASIGKGLHIKANIVKKDLFVEVGAGVVVKKTPQEAVEIIDFQLDKLKEARIHLISKLDIYQKTLDSALEEIQNSQNPQNK